MCCRFPPHFSLKATDEKGSAPLSSVGRAAAPADAAAAATELGGGSSHPAARGALPLGGEVEEGRGKDRKGAVGRW